MLTARQRELLEFIHDYHRRNGVPPSFDEMRAALKLRSKSGIHRLITALVERGFVRRLAYRARAIEILKGPLAGEAAPPAAAREQASEARAAASPDWAISMRMIEGAKQERLACAPRRAVGGGPGPFDSLARPMATGRVARAPFMGRIAAGTPIEAIADQDAAVDVPEILRGAGDHFVLRVVGDSMVGVGIAEGDLVVIERCDDAPSGAIVVALVDESEATLKRLHKKGASIALEAANPRYETRLYRAEQVRVQGRLVGLMRRY